MSKIVRLTESDSVRIVKRVINEGATSVLKSPLNVNGKTYQVQKFGNDTVGFVDMKSPGTGITDAKLVQALNKLAGFAFEAIPSSTGSASVSYIKQHCQKFGDLCTKM
jgi:hypothetical protein